MYTAFSVVIAISSLFSLGCHRAGWKRGGGKRNRKKFRTNERNNKNNRGLVLRKSRGKLQSTNSNFWGTTANDRERCDGEYISLATTSGSRDYIQHPSTDENLVQPKWSRAPLSFLYNVNCMHLTSRGMKIDQT